MRDAAYECSARIEASMVSSNRLYGRNIPPTLRNYENAFPIGPNCLGVLLFGRFTKMGSTKLFATRPFTTMYHEQSLPVEVGQDCSPSAAFLFP